MLNPPPVHLLPGQAQAITVFVNSNGVQPDGSNPGVPDTTSPLIIEPVQNASGASAAVVPTVDPNNNRRVIMTPAVTQIFNPQQTIPWSFRIKAANRTQFVTVGGDTLSPPDASGVFWDGNPVGPA